MKVTGYDIQDAIEMQKKKIKLLEIKFQKGVKRYKDDPLVDIVGLSDEIELAEFSVARLHSLLTEYNFRNVSIVNEQKMNLSEIVRRISVFDLTEVRWRDTVIERTNHHYGSSEDQRKDDTKYRDHVLELDKRIDQQENAQRKAAQMRKLMKLANAQPVELEVSDELKKLLGEF